LQAPRALLTGVATDWFLAAVRNLISDSSLIATHKGCLSLSDRRGRQKKSHDMAVMQREIMAASRCLGWRLFGRPAIDVQVSQLSLVLGSGTRRVPSGFGAHQWKSVLRMPGPD
jgi:hypothetical protein